jgi:hypothetical protein
MVKFDIKKHYLIEKEFSFEMESIDVIGLSRPLTMHWSPEMAQDLSAFHNIDAEAELTAMLSEQLSSEIDREIMDNLRDMWGSMMPEKISVDSIEPTRNIKRHHFTKETFGGLLPISMRVTSQTMGMDLVSVVPMAQPTGNLFYLDYGNPIEPTVHDDGSWNHGKTFGSTLIDFELKPHIFIKRQMEIIDTAPTRFPGRLGTVRGGRRGQRRPTRLNRR